MPASDDHFSEFEPHTRLKHLILQTYLESWTRKMLLRPNAGQRVFIIDACAGPGRDSLGNEGSPVITAQVANIVERQLATEFRRDVQVQTIAIEKNAGHFAQLEEELAPYGDGARALRGELVDHLPAILEEAGPAPILCFIDPFGLDPLRSDVVRAILTRPHCEVFALFADQACLRHFGAAAAAEASVASSPDLFSVAGVLVPTAMPPDRETSAARAITAERAVEILNTTFGSSDWRERIARTPHSARRAEFLRMYEDLLRSCGAGFVLSIPIRNDRNHHVYHLVHASRSAHGFLTMKEAVSTSLNRSGLGDHATETIRFAIRSNLPAIVAEIVNRFAGRTVAWTTASEEGDKPLKEYVLQHTPAYPHELKELRSLLRPFKQPGRAYVYSFPQLLFNSGSGQ